ncbi:MAG: 23S rRNA (uracil(1939)-C(5))-methyltransferase RlmD [Candidatus Accumulibacter sp.]|jgi:23S rRNA (uracil1939-C5)-methyltransferase|nr:23S rRNA (uracil(1939)-C(5))-methyltransferase RlmD [Accumulibacter sp.]
MPVGIIESLDHEARGITRLDGKTVFVEGGLPGERVEYSCYRRKPSYDIARVDRVVEASASRVEPRCPHFGVCGGCSMQHLEASAQLAAKQRLLEANLWHLGRLAAGEIYAPIHGATWGYRFRARLSARMVPKKGGMLIGFHERRSSYVADMRQCPNLPPQVSGLLLPLRELVSALSIRAAMPQIELAVGETMTALVLRILEPLDAADEGLLRAFADRHGVVFYLQAAGPASARRFYPLDERRLSYRLPDYGIEHGFSPTEFTQVNHAVNRVLVRRAMALLDARSGERVADMFCGIGNFTLPIARAGACAVGVEGSPELVRRAGENAAANGLSGQAAYLVANLFTATPESLAALGRFDKMLIDPPREGAVELVKAIAGDAPRRIVYVSCNPATLARDAAILVHQKGYRLRGAGVVNMFPNTSHVESIALFELG